MAALTSKSNTNKYIFCITYSSTYLVLISVLFINTQTTVFVFHRFRYIAPKVIFFFTYRSQKFITKRRLNTHRSLSLAQRIESHNRKYFVESAGRCRVNMFNGQHAETPSSTQMRRCRQICHDCVLSRQATVT